MEKREKELRELLECVRKCKKCGLWKTRNKVVFGEGPINAKIMLIGQAPGKQEDKVGEPFVGRAGKLLNKLLRKAGIKRDECFITSVLKCFPPKNRKPKKQEIRKCKPYLLKQIELIRPKVIVLLGNIAVEAILGKTKLKEIRGKKFFINHMLFVPTYHPAAALRFKQLEKKIEKDLSIAKAFYELCSNHKSN
ncbi:MAG TPA: uracil-DNA glycosylase [Candidatus Pacearchaeota archaeon]|nr:uracil-DNA glycosylase [Candidatus Pacearchaeota archaeon]